MKKGELNMRVMYAVAVAFIIVILAACAEGATRCKGRLARIVCIFESIAFVCGISFALYTFIPDKTVTTLCKGIALACFDWLVLMLMFHAQYYTGMFGKVKIIRTIMLLYSAFDTVALISNTWLHNIFTVGKSTTDEIQVMFIKSSVLYKAHYIYTYLTIIVLLLAYAYMIFKSSRFYRFRYEVIFATLLLGFLLDIVTIGSTSIYDVSMLTFGLMAVLIYYFTLRYVPNELIESTLSLIIKDMNSGIICFDNRERCIYLNELIRDIYKTDDNVTELEHNYSEWLKSRSKAGAEPVKFDMSIDKDGKRRSYEILYKRIMDDKNNHICDYFIFNDRTEEIESYEHEKYKASHDSLTGLLNKEQFYIEVNRLIHCNPDKRYYMICSNIKDFKFVNELFGIERGDSILRKQAQLMQTYAKGDSLCARLQSDRFAICMPKERFSERLIYSLVRRMQNEFKNNSFRLHVFAGVYDIVNIGEPVSIMCDKANIASETIKDDYQSSIAYYDEYLLERSIEERRIIGEFDRALDNNEFVMYIQPQVDDKGVAHGGEALVRWLHPDRGLLSPAVFIDVLEKTGLIYKLDEYMWDKAAQKLSEWKEKGINNYHISVNISTKDFYLVDVYEIFVGLVEKYDINPELLKLEITETALMSDFKKNMEILRRLQNYGFKIEIDDFGSGYSSLNMLKDISADVLKIDMGFLRATDNEIKCRDILESIIVLAGKLGMEVITEGVENENQFNMLTNMGCKMFQGYYFSRPDPAVDFEKKYNIEQTQ